MDSSKTTFRLYLYLYLYFLYFLQGILYSSGSTGNSPEVLRGNHCQDFTPIIFE